MKGADLRAPQLLAAALHHCAGQLCTDIRQQAMCEPSPSCCAGFFGQFGSVKNVRLSRSKRTAKSKGFAFVEFKCPEVAPIAAKAMDGYMMFSQKLKVHAVKQKDVHPELFKGGLSSPFCRAAAACLARCLDSQPRGAARQAGAPRILQATCWMLAASCM